MTTECLEAVSRLNEAIENAIGPQRYKIWFKNSTRLVLEDGYLKIGVPNLFIGGWIENHFSSQITKVASEITGFPVRLIFTIDPELFGSQRRYQLDSQAKSVERSTNPSLNQRRSKKQLLNHPELRYKLDTFVVGTSNELAYNAVCSVVAEPVSHYNPLFIHGGCGLGKTHLLQGICNAVSRKCPGSRFEYVSGEDFTNQFILALKTGKVDLFRRRFRSADLLVIDDVHFLASKKATQEEFLYTFNAINSASHQIVLACDAHPKMIGQLSEQLVSRFISGMVIKIDPPDYDTRCKILAQRAKTMKKQISKSVIEYIARHIVANVRELEGAFLKVVAYASLNHSPVTLPLTREALEDHVALTDPIVHLSDIESVVATFFGLTPADIHSSRKTRIISLARSLAMYLARKHTSMSFPEIGRFMGNKNHATVILACRKVENLLKSPDKILSWDGVNGRREMKVEDLLKKLEVSINR